MKRLLDIGCGPAPTVLEAIEDSGWSVEYVGLDGNEKIIETAKRRHPEAKFTKVLIPYEFQPEELGKYDIVTAFTFFEYLNRPEKAATVCGISQVLHKYGEVVSTFSRKKERDAIEIEQFFRSLGYDVPSENYVALDFEDIEGSRYFWKVEGRKEEHIDTEQKFSKYTAMAYLKARRVKEAESFGFHIRSLADELRKLESVNVVEKPEIPDYSPQIKELEREEGEMKEILKNISPQMRRTRKYYNMYRQVTERLEKIKRDKLELKREHHKEAVESISRLVI